MDKLGGCTWTNGGDVHCRYMCEKVGVGMTVGMGYR